jgi:hypothetical protein
VFLLTAGNCQILGGDEETTRGENEMGKLLSRRLGIVDDATTSVRVNSGLALALNAGTAILRLGFYS